MIVFEILVLFLSAPRLPRGRPGGCPAAVGAPAVGAARCHPPKLQGKQVLKVFKEIKYYNIILFKITTIIFQHKI